MYEPLTAFIPAFTKGQYGEWIVDKKNDGSRAHPIQMPYVNYGKSVSKLEDAIYQFQDKHPDFGLNEYGDILRSHGIEWNKESMTQADVNSLDGKTVMALLLGAVRAERFCSGALLSFCENGRILKWLKRLKELDELESQ